MEEYINKPFIQQDGTKILLTSLTNQVTNRQHIRLNTGRTLTPMAELVQIVNSGTLVPKKPGRPSPYTHEDRAWMLNHSMAQIAMRYEVDLYKARCMKNATTRYFRDILKNSEPKD